MNTPDLNTLFLGFCQGCPGGRHELALSDALVRVELRWDIQTGRDRITDVWRHRVGVRDEELLSVRDLGYLGYQLGRRAYAAYERHVPTVREPAPAGYADTLE